MEPRSSSNRRVGSAPVPKILIGDRRSGAAGGLQRFSVCVHTAQLAGSSFA
jgi:hypothetical protein